MGIDVPLDGFTRYYSGLNSPETSTVAYGFVYETPHSVNPCRMYSFLAEDRETRDFVQKSIRDDGYKPMYSINIKFKFKVYCGVYK
jgi:hypothetical protein